MASDDSLESLMKLAEAGDGAAAWELATRFRNGEGLPRDLQAAFHWYSRGAALGDREAQNDLGTMFLRGFACAVDAEKAVYWYRKSAEQGCVDAQWNLAKRYLHGEGVEVDYATAYHWFSQAGRHGHMAAVCELGTMHRFGHGVPRNLLAAADFHVIAAQSRDVVACGNLAEYRAELEQMARSGNQMACLHLCKMHNRGLGADRSQALTWAWIRWAREYCSPDRDAEIIEEVGETYEFYRKHIDPDQRRSGQRAVAEWRATQGRRSSDTRKAKGTARNRRTTKLAR